jgi:hypothetical protein
MKLELQEPFKSLWRNGYLVTNPENRRNVCLVNSDVDRTTISYARYLMSVKLGYLVPHGLEVDHIDNDKTNDVIENLQLLTQQENSDKNNKLNIIYYSFTCCICKNIFQLTGKQLGQRRDKTNPTCSKVCGYKKVSDTLKAK